jgi:hypothetical protein
MSDISKLSIFSFDAISKVSSSKRKEDSNQSKDEQRTLNQKRLANMEIDNTTKRSSLTHIKVT